MAIHLHSPFHASPNKKQHCFHLWASLSLSPITTVSLYNEKCGLRAHRQMQVHTHSCTHTHTHTHRGKHTHTHTPPPHPHPHPTRTSQKCQCKTCFDAFLQTVPECIQYYYLMKKSENYKQLLRKQNMKRNKKALQKSQVCPCSLFYSLRLLLIV